MYEKFEIIYNYGKEDLTGLSFEEIKGFREWSKAELSQKFSDHMITVENKPKRVSSLSYTDDDANNDAVIRVCEKLLYRYKKFHLPRVKIHNKIVAADHKEKALREALNKCLEEKIFWHVKYAMLPKEGKDE